MGLANPQVAAYENSLLVGKGPMKSAINLFFLIILNLTNTPLYSQEVANAGDSAPSVNPAVVSKKFVVQCSDLVKRLGSKVDGQENLSAKTLKGWSKFLASVANPQPNLLDRLKAKLRGTSSDALPDSIYSVLREIETHMVKNFTSERLPAKNYLGFENASPSEDPVGTDFFTKISRQAELRAFLKSSDSKLLTLGVKVTEASWELDSVKEELSEDAKRQAIEAEIKTLTTAVATVDRNIEALKPVESKIKVAGKAPAEESPEIKAKREENLAALTDEKSKLNAKLSEAQGRLTAVRNAGSKILEAATKKVNEAERAHEELEDTIKNLESERDHLKKELANSVPRETFVRLLRHWKIEDQYNARREEDRKREEAAAAKKAELEAERAAKEAEKAAREKAKKDASDQVEEIKRRALEVQAEWKKTSGGANAGEQESSSAKPDSKAGVASTSKSDKKPGKKPGEEKIDFSKIGQKRVDQGQPAKKTGEK